MQKTGVVSIGGVPVPYEIARASRRTIKIQVSGEGVVLVTAPKRLSAEAIQSEVERHGAWLQKRLALSRALAEDVAELRSHRAAQLFGERIPIRCVSDGKKRARFELQDGTLYAYNCGERLGEKLLAFYREQTSAVIEQLLAVHSARMGISPRLWTVKSQQRRWGSCNARQEIRFNRLLCLLPIEVIEYVVVHELCHLRQMNHSAAFWREVAAILPDYERRRQVLRTQGDGLAACYQKEA